MAGQKGGILHRQAGLFLLFHYGQFERTVKAGRAEQQKFPEVLRHLVAEGAGNVDDDMGPAASAFAELEIEFLEKGEHGPEIHPFNDTDMADTIRIDHDPVRLRLPEKPCLCFHALLPPRADSLRFQVPCPAPLFSGGWLLTSSYVEPYECSHIGNRRSCSASRGPGIWHLSACT